MLAAARKFRQIRRIGRLSHPQVLGQKLAYFKAAGRRMQFGERPFSSHED
jgi:hypothetical protein